MAYFILYLDNARLLHDLLPAEDFWIGATNFPSLDDKTFVWKNLSPWDWTNWNINQPNYKHGQHCVKVKKNINKWDDVSCAKTFKFACQKKAQ